MPASISRAAGPAGTLPAPAGLAATDARGFSEIELGHSCGPVDLEATPELLYGGALLEKTEKNKLWATVWAALTKAWDFADDQLAYLFGLDESKYEWAVREHLYQKRQEALRREKEAPAGQDAVQPGQEGTPILTAPLATEV
ncbi:hypothetical protein WJX72_002055 [[Myrmecia] bisecta]|uniref:Uncharacterized protein n=1 Tax=[Myrmecia] bisecta TaxID=41462 RepID=A0AAW1Q3K7_9CHLO